MNFLELCQDLAREAGISGSGSIATVANQNGEAQRVVNWIVKAYRYIQNKHANWKFLQAAVGFDTTANNATYTALAAGTDGFGEWRFASYWRCYNKALGVADEQPVCYLPYDAFRERYLYSTSRLQMGRPQVVTEAPDQSLIFWPVPDNIYTIVGEQYKAPLALVANTDVPIFAARFHDVIVQRALMYYGEFEGDPSVFTAAQSECRRILAKMEELYLPDFEDAEPMA